MPLKLSRRVFLISAALCVLLRVYLHVAHIDPATGFYSGGQVFVILYEMILVAAVAVLMVLGLRGKPENPGIAVTPFLRFTMLAASIGAAVMAVPVPAQIMGPTYLPVSRAAIMLRLFVLSLSPLITAVMLIYMAVKSRDRLAHINGCLMLFPVVWMASVLLMRFMDYTASRHVSDQMLTIVTLALATLFLMPMGRFAGGLTPQKAARQLLAFGPSFGLLAFSDCAGILAGPTAFYSGTEEKIQLAFSTPECIAFLLLGLFAVTLAFSMREMEPDPANQTEGSVSAKPAG